MNQQKLHPKLQEETMKLAREQLPLFTDNTSVPMRRFSNGVPYAHMQLDDIVMPDGPCLQRDFSSVRESYIKLKNRHNDKNIF